MEIKPRGDSHECINCTEYKGSNVLNFLNHDNSIYLRENNGGLCQGVD